MGFDDHDENFITLNNRNFSKLILEQFDKDREDTSTQIFPKEADQEAFVAKSPLLKSKTKIENRQTSQSFPR